MSRTNESTNLVFINSQDNQKADQETRKLIRKHVMQGKNRVKPRRKRRLSPHTESGNASLILSTTDNGDVLPAISTHFASKFAAVRFADTVEPALIEDVLLFSSIMSKVMFTVDHCIAPATATTSRAWFECLLIDAAYLNAACFTTQAFFDGFFGRSRSIQSRLKDRTQYAKTVRILRRRLVTKEDLIRFSSSTIRTILALWGHAYATGDHRSAATHGHGLLNLVKISGVHTLFDDVTLLIEILRCDLSWSMDNFSKPMLFARDEVPWPLALNKISGHNKKNYLPMLAYDLNTGPSLCSEFNTLWIAASDFCLSINEAYEGAGDKISKETFVHAMGSIMYRLLHTQYQKGSLEETCRLGLLAFLSPIFLQWTKYELADPRFTSSYRNSLELLRKNNALQQPILLWLLVVGALSMSQESEDYAWIRPLLCSHIKLCNIVSWEDMKELLRLSLWVDNLYDEPCESLLMSLRKARDLHY